MPKPFDDERLAQLVQAAESGEVSGLTESEMRLVSEYRSIGAALNVPHTPPSDGLLQKLGAIFVPQAKRNWLAVLRSGPSLGYAVRGESEGLREYQCEVATVRLTVAMGLVMGQIEPADWEVSYQDQKVETRQGEFELPVATFDLNGLKLVRGEEEVRLTDTGE